MTRNMTKVVDTKIKRVFETSASALLIAAMTIVMMFGTTSAVSADTAGSWAITIGDEQVLYVDSYEEGQQVIEGLKDYYLTQGATVLDVQFNPEIKVERATSASGGSGSYFAAESTSVSVDDAVAKLSEGKTDYSLYEVQEGDTLESIAKAKGLSANKLSTINGSKYDTDETIKEGTYVVIYSETPYVNVTTVEKITSAKSIAYDTVYKNTSSLNKGQFKVVAKGSKGERQYVKQVTKLNGEVTSSDTISSEVTKEPVDRVVLKGTDSVTAQKGVTYDFADGTDVVEYAKKFIGNPYVYGGTSLTNGCDCSGFAYALYAHFGVNLPRVGQTSVGKTVSTSNLKVGDIVFYSGHVAIYAGNGKVIHAVNERLGIRITSIGYTGYVYAARRIFD